MHADRIKRGSLDGRAVCCRVLEPAGPGESRVALGRPLLLIHGLACSAEVWRPTLSCLGQRGLDQAIWAPDMPGYGHSPGPREALGIEELADDPLGHAGAVMAPCLVVRGEGDAIIPEAAARRLAAALPRGAFAMVKDSAHAVQFHRPEPFTCLLLDFLSTAAVPSA